jgi:hypothetical protein
LCLIKKNKQLIKKKEFNMTACLRPYLPILSEQVDFLIIEQDEVPVAEMTRLNCLVTFVARITFGIIGVPLMQAYLAYGAPVNGEKGSHPNRFYKFADITLNLLLGPITSLISAVKHLAAAIFSPSIAYKPESE